MERASQGSPGSRSADRSEHGRHLRLIAGELGKLGLGADGEVPVASLEADRQARDDEGLPVQVEIGYLLGFADQSTFNRAFKRWTGFTPRQARAGAGRAKPASRRGRPEAR
jgi:hypothetical protein